MKEGIINTRIRRRKSRGITGELSGVNYSGMSALEFGLCAVVVIGCILLHFVPTYTQLGLPIEVTLSLISFVTPVSGVLYLSAAQVIPDPPGSPLSSAQMALAGFFLWQLAKGKVIDLLRIGRPLWVTVAPFFVWNAGLALLHGDHGWQAFTLLFAVLTGCATAALIGQSGKRLAVCLLVFLAGQALAMCLFWILKLHLGTPTQAFNIEIYGDSTLEGMRIGTARGNANTLGPPMSLACVGAIAWFISLPRAKWLGGIITLICLAAVVPPLIGSGSRGAIVTVVMGVMFLLIAGFLSGRSFINASLAICGIAAVLIFGWHRLGLDESWNEVETRQQEQQVERGGLYAGRELEWTAAWNGIMNSPLLGGGAIEKLSYFDNPEMWVSHSTYLDAGLVGGFPGMALFVWLVMKPILELWRRKYQPTILWLLAVYVVSIISIGSTSSMQSKYFWMLWGMAAVFFLPAEARVKKRGHPMLRRDKMTMVREFGADEIKADRSLA